MFVSRNIVPMFRPVPHEKLLLSPPAAVQVASSVPTFRAASSAQTASALRATGARVPIAPGADGDGNALDDASVVVTNRVHAVVDGKIAANEISAHRGVFTRQGIRFVVGVGLVLAVIDPHHTLEASTRGVGFVEGVRPTSSPA